MIIWREESVPGKYEETKHEAQKNNRDPGGTRSDAEYQSLCGNSVRATKTVRIMCMDCMQQMNEV